MRRIVVMSSLLCLSMVAASCNHDGRTLRPARPDQTASISTTAAPSTSSEPGLGSVLDDLGTAPATGANAPASTRLPASTVDPVDSAGQSSSLDAEAPWTNGGAIESRYTCAGIDVSPALSWPAAPAGTIEVAITMTDQQRPEYIHWTLAGLSAETTGLQEGIVPPNAVEGLNSSGTAGYIGPCPPKGETHTYVITVHYLGAQIEVGDSTPAADMRLAIDAATDATAQVSGTFKSG